MRSRPSRPEWPGPGECQRVALGIRRGAAVERHVRQAACIGRYRLIGTRVGHGRLIVVLVRADVDARVAVVVAVDDPQACRRDPLPEAVARRCRPRRSRGSPDPQAIVAEHVAERRCAQTADRPRCCRAGRSDPGRFRRTRGRSGRRRCLCSPPATAWSSSCCSRRAVCPPLATMTLL